MFFLPWLLLIACVEEARSYVVGVLAKNGPDKAFSQWNSTFATYLSEATGIHFEMAALSFAEVYPAIADKKVDFVFANPSYFVCAELWYSIQAISTILNLRSGFALNKFGAVLFRATSRPDIKTIKDLDGKIFEAVDFSSLGGFQMGWRDLVGHDLHPYTSPRQFRIGKSHENVVMDVLDGTVDIGTVRTDTLERMAASGAIKMSDITILDSEDYQGTFPFQVSTELYPEWPLAALKSVPEDVKREVAIALMNLDKTIPDHAAILKTAKIESWVPALSYVPVYSALRDLGLVDKEGNCIEGETPYDNVLCPEGYMKVPEKSVFVPDCPADRTCLNTPCVPFCEPGMYEVSGACLTCPPGFSCRGFKHQPEAKPGHMMLLSDPLSAYKCVPADACPGGAPDSCNGGRVGLACASCPVGFVLRDGECTKCAGGNSLGLAAMWICVIAFSVMVIFLSNGKVTARPTPHMAFQGNTALLITFVQVIGILAFLDLEYPSGVSDFLTFFSKFALNINEVLPVSCNADAGPATYTNTMMVFPVASVGILIFKVISSFTPLRQWLTWAKTINSVGAALMIGFTTIANLALTPFMCFGHPNGLKSVLKYPGVLCDFAGDHASMVAAGTLLLLIALAFYGACVWTVLKAPRWTNGEDVTQFHIASRFLTFAFRLDRWFWGIILLPRGLALSFVPVLAADDSRVQAMLFLGVSLFYVVSMMAYAPWRVPALVILDALMWTSITLFSAFVGSFAPMDAEVDVKAYDVFLVLVLGFICCILLASLSLSGSLVLCRGRQGQINGTFLLRRKLPDLDQLAEDFVKVCKTLDIAVLANAATDWQQSDVEAMIHMLEVLHGNGCVTEGATCDSPKRTPSNGRIVWPSTSTAGINAVTKSEDPDAKTPRQVSEQAWETQAAAPEALIDVGVIAVSPTAYRYEVV